MHNDATHPLGSRALDVAPNALRHALRDYRPRAVNPFVPALCDSRDGCIAVASAIHQYLMTQRLLRAPG